MSTVSASMSAYVCLHSSAVIITEA